MFQVRFHGRGGQGTVTTAELLSLAAFAEGRYAQAFPSFGAERTGAPVEAYCRIAEHPIRLREPVRRPDAVIVQDAALRHHVDVFAGLVTGGYVLVNSLRDWAGLGLDRYGERLRRDRTMIVPATDLALEHSAGRFRAPRCWAGSPPCPARSVSTRSWRRSAAGSTARRFRATWMPPRPPTPLNKAFVSRFMIEGSRSWRAS